MTIEQAKNIIKTHRNEKYYSVSLLQSGYIVITNVFENGFTFKRKTDYIETVGIYEQLYESNNCFDCDSYNIAEVVTKRY